MKKVRAAPAAPSREIPAPFCGPDGTFDHFPEHIHVQCCYVFPHFVPVAALGR